MIETDAEFLDNLELWVIGSLVFKPKHRERLFALARRGAEMNDAVKCEKELEHQDRRYNVAERLFGDD